MIYVNQVIGLGVGSELVVTGTIAQQSWVVTGTTAQVGWSPERQRKLGGHQNDSATKAGISESLGVTIPGVFL